MQNPDKKLNQFLEEEKTFLEELEKVNLDKNWDRFQRTLKAESPLALAEPFIRKYRFLFRAAAAAVLLLMVSATLYFTTYLPSHHMLQTLAEPGHTDIILSDGTTISLNEGAVLNYPEKLKRRVREVSLTGEAYFEVHRAEMSPFFVFVGDMTIRVTGTSFNIREDATGNIEVAVVEGEVLFYESGKEDKAVRIIAGQQSVYRADQQLFETKKSGSENFLFWRTGTLTYEDTPLQEVFEELEMYFKREIMVTDPEILQEIWYAVHRSETFKEIIEELCVYFDLECIVSNDTILVQRKSP